VASYRRALELTGNQVERSFLQQQLTQLEAATQ
jgi:predicted RNA polymerase sigma factor